MICRRLRNGLRIESLHRREHPKDVCRSFVTQCLAPTIIWMRKLAEAGRSPEERTLLENLRDAGLAVINASAKEAANLQPNSKHLGI